MPYLFAFAMSARRAFYAPAPHLANAVFYVSLIVVYSALWKAVIESAGGVLNGYNHHTMTCYMAGAQIAVASTRQQLINDIGTDVDSRAVEAEMLRPVSMFGLRFATEVGTAMARVCILAPVALVLIWILVGGVPSWRSALLVPVAALIGVACNTAAQHFFGAIAFWLRDSKAGWFLYQKCVFLLGAMLLPIQMLPGFVQTAIWFLPFWTMAYAPARLAAGYFEPWLLAGQLAWLAAIVFVASRIFAKGEQRLQTAGG